MKTMTTSNVRRKEIAEKLREVIDPELGVNIVDLGLIYNIDIEEYKVTVEYTATTPGCPMRRYLQQKIEEALNSFHSIKEYEAKLVWEPEWNVDMIKENVDFFGHPPPQI